REKRQRAALAFLRMDDVDLMGFEDASEAPGRREIDLGRHRQRVMHQAPATAEPRPMLARPRDHDDLVPPLRELLRQLAELNRCPGEVVVFWIDLQDAHGAQASAWGNASGADRRAVSAKNAGSTSRVSRVDDHRPPMTPRASGRWISEPMPWDIA